MNYKKKNICPAPFSQLYIHPNGDVSICCDSRTILGNVFQDSLQTIWLSPILTQIRQDFLNNTPPTICKQLMAMTNCHLKYSYMLSDLTFKNSDYPIAFDCTLNNACNINCIMCLSKNSQSVPGTEQAFLNFIENIDTIKYFSIKSGEPFSQNQTLSLIRQINNKHPECKFEITTSGVFVLTTEIMSLMEDINLHAIRVSVDSLCEKNYQKIRPNGNLELALNNLNYFSKIKLLPKNYTTEIALNMTIQKSNWNEVFDMYLFCERKRIRFSPQFVFYPEELSLTSLSQQEIDNVVTSYTKYITQKPAIYLSLKEILLPILNMASRKVKIQFELESAVFLNKLNNLEKQVTMYKEKDCFPCSMPFTHLEIFPDGRAQPCCWLPNNHQGNLKNNTIEEIFQSDSSMLLRQEFLTNSISICKQAIAERKCNIHKLPFDLELTPNGKLTTLGLNLDPKCNQSCVMCDISRQPDDKIFESLDWAQNNLQVLTNIKKIIFKGGEPFIQDRFYNFVDYMLKINPNCVWIIYTNGNHQYSSKISNTLKKINLEYISVSIDSLNEETFSKIRRGGSLNMVKQFSKSLSADLIKKPSLGLVTIATWHKNLMGIADVIRFANHLGFYSDILPVAFPEECSFCSCSKEQLQTFISHINEIKDEFPHVDFKPLQQTISCALYNSVST